jgi:hypothetical protein
MNCRSLIIILGMIPLALLAGCETLVVVKAPTVNFSGPTYATNMRRVSCGYELVKQRDGRVTRQERTDCWKEYYKLGDMDCVRTSYQSRASFYSGKPSFQQNSVATCNKTQDGCTLTYELTMSNSWRTPHQDWREGSRLVGDTCAK